MAGGGRKQLCRRLGPGAPAWMILRGICRLRNMREISRKNSEPLYTKLNMHFCRVHSRTFAYIQKTRVHSRTFAYIRVHWQVWLPGTSPHLGYMARTFAYNQRVAFFARTFTYNGMPQNLAYIRVHLRTFARLQCLRYTPTNATEDSLREAGDFLRFLHDTAFVCFILVGCCFLIDCHPTRSEPCRATAVYSYTSMSRHA